MAPHFTAPYTPVTEITPWPLTIDQVQSHTLAATHTAHVGLGVEHPPTMVVTTDVGDDVIMQVTVEPDHGGGKYTLSVVAMSMLAVLPVRMLAFSMPMLTRLTRVDDPRIGEDLNAAAEAGDVEVMAGYLVGSLDLDAPTWDDAHRVDVLISPLEEGGPWQLTTGGGDVGGPIVRTLRVIYDRGRQIATSAPADATLRTAMGALSAAGVVTQALIPEELM